MTEDKPRDKKSTLEKEILRYFPQTIRDVLLKADPAVLSDIEEIRLRAGKPVTLLNSDGDWFVNKEGKLTCRKENAYIADPMEITRTLELMSEKSVYAYQDEVRNGFITLRGGHRVGIAGRVVLENGMVKNIKDISGLNIRISREVPGCSGDIIRYIIRNSSDIYNTLIISPPQCGKTTLLRDIARIISDGTDRYNFKGVKVGVVDERSEIAACFKGVPQNNVGIRTDVLDGCPKTVGMDMMPRSMSPRVIITDEIGNQGDRDAILRVVNAGVKIIATAHGYGISDLKTRREVLNLMEDKIFERYIVLSNAKGPGTLEEVVDGLTMRQLVAGRQRLTG